MDRWLSDSELKIIQSYEQGLYPTDLYVAMSISMLVKHGWKVLRE